MVPTFLIGTAFLLVWFLVTSADGTAMRLFWKGVLYFVFAPLLLVPLGLLVGGLGLGAWRIATAGSPRTVKVHSSIMGPDKPISFENVCGFLSGIRLFVVVRMKLLDAGAVRSLNDKIRSVGGHSKDGIWINV